MEKISGYLSKDYGAIKAYLDEIIDIEAILKSACRNVKLITNGYSYDSLDELRQHRQQTIIHELKIVGHSPHIDFAATKTGVRLYAGSDGSAEAGLFYQLDRIILKTTRKPQLLFSYYFLVACLLAVYGLTLWAAPHPSTAISTLIIFLSLSLLWIGALRFWRSSVLVLEYRSRHQDFFKRNADKLVLSAITTTVGLIVGALSTKYGANFWNVVGNMFRH